MPLSCLGRVPVLQSCAMFPECPCHMPSCPGHVLVMSLSCALLVCLCRVQPCLGHVKVMPGPVMFQPHPSHVLHGQLQITPLHVRVLYRSCHSHFSVRLVQHQVISLSCSSHVAVTSRSCYIVISWSCLSHVLVQSCPGHEMFGSCFLVMSFKSEFCCSHVEVVF